MADDLIPLLTTNSLNTADVLAEMPAAGRRLDFMRWYGQRPHLGREPGPLPAL